MNGQEESKPASVPQSNSGFTREASMDSKTGSGSQVPGHSTGANHGKAKRKVRNYMLDPMLQVKLGLYCILLALAFAVTLGTILYTNFANLITSIVLMTDAQEEVTEIFSSYWGDAQLWLYLAFVAYLVLTVIVSVLYTHKLVGPTIAFKRHVRNLTEGRYGVRTHLREGDAFADVATELNQLSAALESKAKDGKLQS